MNLSKSTKVILITIAILSFIGLGYLIWRVNQPETLAPEDSDAGGGSGACCNLSIGCTAGWKCVEKSCDETENAIYDPGSNDCGQDYRCRKLPSGTSDCINQAAHTCRVVQEGTCVRETDPGGPTEGDCKDYKCEWPQVLMSGLSAADKAAGKKLCRCELCTKKKTGQPWSCTGNPPTCNPGGCPSGKVSCGTSVEHEGSGCHKFVGASCTTYHPDCNNPSVIYRYCKDAAPKPTPPPPVQPDPVEPDTEEPEPEEPDPVEPEPKYPEYVVTKSVIEKCIDEDTPEPKSEVTYTIIIKNIGEGDGSINKVVDSLDSKVKKEFVQVSTIPSPGIYSSIDNTIVADFSTEPLLLKSGDSIEGGYKLVVDKNSFGKYTNTVVVTPTSGDEISATANINIDCEATEDTLLEEEEETVKESIPETGIFDDTRIAILTGILFLFLGITWTKIGEGTMLSVKYLENKKSENRKNRFEKKIIGKK